jgi:broad specificity phosphatase PhoE
LAPAVLILVRHGATRANTVRPYILQGLRPDSELVEEGIVQTRVTIQALWPYPIVKLYCSPLKRAQATARLLADSFSVPLDVEEALAEVDVGQWTSLTWEEIEQRWPNEYRAFQEAPERHGYLGGENLTQVRDRVLPTIERLVERHVGATFAIVGHGVVNRVLLAQWLGMPLCQARRLPQENAAFNIIHFHRGAALVRTLNSSTYSPEMVVE